jgi:hypothetical protein
MNQPTVGVSADGLWIQYAHSLAGTDGWQVATRQLGGGNSIPNAILLPKVEGEPYRFDLGITSHPRGCGFNWPTEAIVDSDIGSGRLPIGCILNRIESGNNVVWKYGHEQNHTCTDALASAIAQVYTGHEGALVFVIPNSWNVGLQQSFLDAFQKENLKYYMTQMVIRFYYFYMIVFLLTEPFLFERLCNLLKMQLHSCGK